MIKKQLPNFITCLNLFCGCLAIVATFHKSFEMTAILVTIAMFFDFLDGLMARVLRVQSNIGKQLDSLADMVTFGIVPGFVMYQLILFTIGSKIIQPDKTAAIWYLAYMGMLIPIFSAIRLAKFNVDIRQTDSFIGMPTPATALFIVSLPLIVTHSTNLFIINWLMNPFFLILICIILSLLMIAEIPLISLKFKHLGWYTNRMRYTLILSSLVLLITLQYIAIPLIILLYIILSVFKFNSIKNKTSVNN